MANLLGSSYATCRIRLDNGWHVPYGYARSERYRPPSSDPTGPLGRVGLGATGEPVGTGSRDPEGGRRERAGGRRRGRRACHNDLALGAWSPTPDRSGSGEVGRDTTPLGDGGV